MKTFKHKNMIIVLKTNLLKNNKCYFGDNNLDNIFTGAYNDVKYRTTLSPEHQLIELFKYFHKEGIKPESITMNDITHTGTLMSDVGASNTDVEGSK